jgi:hypothetical protein
VWFERWFFLGVEGGFDVPFRRNPEAVLRQIEDDFLQSTLPA